MNSYANLMDYLGDRRPPHCLKTPPGGDMGPANAFVCDIAETLRSIPTRAHKAEFLLNEGAILRTLPLPAPLTGHEAAIVQRLADWYAELRLVADNTDHGGKQCTAR